MDMRVNVWEGSLRRRLKFVRGLGERLVTNVVKGDVIFAAKGICKNNVDVVVNETVNETTYETVNEHSWSFHDNTNEHWRLIHETVNETINETTKDPTVINHWW